MGRQLHLLGLGLALGLCLVACTQQEATPDPTPYAREVTTFHYLTAQDTTDLALLSQLVEGLVTYGPDGEVLPALAESWTSSQDDRVWTFQLRTDVMWVDSQGSEVAQVTAQDWVTTAQWVNDATNNASQQYLYQDLIAKASDYYDYTAQVEEITQSTASDFDKELALDKISPVYPFQIGVRAQDDFTLVFTLTQSTPYFPSVLCNAGFLPVYAPFLTEKGDAFGVDNTAILYTGAYTLSQFIPQSTRVLTPNPSYWGAGATEALTYTYDAIAVTETQNTGWVTAYYYAFNFQPQFDNSLHPTNWTLAVHNLAFRQSLMAAMDTLSALETQGITDPDVATTITPENFVGTTGKDFTQYAPLKDLSSQDSFDALSALKYKAVAMEELTAQGATFPVTVYMPYDPSVPGWAEECAQLEGQMESLLGEDYIDIVVEAGPSTNFVSQVQEAGDYGLMKCSWSGQYTDPQTWTTPFLSLAARQWDTQVQFNQYRTLVSTASAITNPISQRYTAFAQAEALLLENAFVIPFYHVYSEIQGE